MPSKQGADASACASAGSTSLEVSNTGFCLRYTKQNDTVKPETCHRALNINPLYAEGQAKQAVSEMPTSLPKPFYAFVFMGV